MSPQAHATMIGRGNSFDRGSVNPSADLRLFACDQPASGLICNLGLTAPSGTGVETSFPRFQPRRPGELMGALRVQRQKRWARAGRRRRSAACSVSRWQRGKSNPRGSPKPRKAEKWEPDGAVRVEVPRAQSRTRQGRDVVLLN
jgi:hypothetical protein